MACGDYEVLKKVFEIMTKERISLSRYNDVVILTHAILPLVTFDKRFSSLAKRYSVHRTDPKGVY
ncbi:MAG: hypothetical protein OWQ54_00455 [Sulfolobaceae archaeon]|nr:hypothetical protein [Sulfolobaceae archaeon]